MSPQNENPNSAQPLYLQIARQLESDILSQREPGDWLPSESDLAQSFGVNRHTLRRAIDDLIAAGLVERRVGRGIRVLASYLDYTIGKATRFTETVSAAGKTAESELLFIRLIAPSAGVQDRLQISSSEAVIWIESLRKADDAPLCVISHFLPHARFGALPDEYTGGSLHGFLRSRYGLALRRTESLITAVMPMGQDSHLLMAPQNRPLLRVKSLNVNAANGEPVEYSVTRFRSDRTQLRVNP